MKRLAAALVLTLSAAPLAAHDTDVTAAARTFLASLRPELKSECVQPFEGEERTSWSYLPGRRPGVALEDLNPAERAAAFAMLRAGLSARGYEKSEDVIVLEGILGRDPGPLLRDGLRRRRRTSGPGPGASRATTSRFTSRPPRAAWSRRRRRSSARNRRAWPRGRTRGSAFSAPRRTPRAGFSRASTLASARRPSSPSARRATSSSAPRESACPIPRGFRPRRCRRRSARSCRSSSRSTPATSPNPSRGPRSEKIERAGIERIRFAWAGGTEPGQGHYYRVQGPTFVIEYDNTQNRANHAHSVFRDLENDFGGDLLRKHYAESPHHAGAAGAGTTGNR